MLFYIFLFFILSDYAAFLLPGETTWRLLKLIEAEACDFHTSVPRGSGTKANTAHSYCCRRVFTEDVTLFTGAGSLSV